MKQDKSNKTGQQRSDQQRPDQQRPQTGQRGKVQGEGDYEAARRYNRETAEHAQSGHAEQQARDAEPSDRAEARELERAEQQGRERAKEEDPLLDDPERISREGIVDGDTKKR